MSTEYWGEKPLLWHNYSNGYLQVRAETRSSNQTSVAELAQVAAFIAAEYQPDCHFVRVVEEKWLPVTKELTRQGSLIVQCLDSNDESSVLVVKDQIAAYQTEVKLLRRSRLLWQSSLEKDIALFEARVTELKKPRFSIYSKDLVLRVQDQLKYFGYLEADADGKWGSHSRRAMKTFQMDNGLTISGEFNSESLTLLGIKGLDETSKESNNDDLPPYVDEAINRGTSVPVNVVD